MSTALPAIRRCLQCQQLFRTKKYKKREMLCGQACRSRWLSLNHPLPTSNYKQRPE